MMDFSMEVEYFFRKKKNRIFSEKKWNIFPGEGTFFQEKEYFSIVNVYQVKTMWRKIEVHVLDKKR